MQNYNLWKVKQELLEYYDFQCQSCSGTFSQDMLQLEHIIAIGNGGDKFDKNNIQLLCWRCHKRKTVSDKILMRKRKMIDLYS